MELVFIFYIPLLHNIIQVKCLTLYEYASVKVISLKKKKKYDLSLDTGPVPSWGRHTYNLHANIHDLQDFPLLLVMKIRKKINSMFRNNFHVC